ncbi:unnamed protein product [Closterium sp. Yama58-4]|nr:unnamed protein product [Closterium sp. Yama58-4]
MHSRLFLARSPLCLPLLFASLSSLPPSPLCLPLLFASLSSLPPSPLCLPLLFASLSSLPPSPLCLPLLFASLSSLPPSRLCLPLLPASLSSPPPSPLSPPFLSATLFPSLQGDYTFTFPTSLLSSTPLHHLSSSAPVTPPPPLSPTTPPLPPPTTHTITAMEAGGESSFVPWRRVELSRAGDFDGSHMDGSQDSSWVPRGSYQLVPEISPDEVAAGLVFSPSMEESVTVTSAPITDIIFKQSHLFIFGKVQCLQECDSTVSVSLWALTGNGADERADERAGGETEQQQGTFLQRVVLPAIVPLPCSMASGAGRREHVNKMLSSPTSSPFPPPSSLHTQQARKAPANATGLQSDEWCWEEEGRADVAVFDSPVTNVQLAQRGWRMVVRAEMEDKFTLTHRDYDPTDFSVSPGVQEFCVESPGEYTLAMSHACAYYGALSFSFHTRQPKPILLTPTAYRVSGPVFLNTSLLPPSLSHLSLEATIVARISGNGGGSDSYGSLSVRRPPSKEDPVAIYDQASIVARICGNEDSRSDSYGSLSVRRPPSKEDPVAVYRQVSIEQSLISCSLPTPPALSPSLLLSPHPSCSLPIPPALSPSLLLSPHPSCSLPIPPALSPSLLLSPHPSCSLPIPPALSPSLLLSPHPSCSLPIPPALSPSLLLSPHPSCSLPIPPALSPSLLLSPHPSCSLPIPPALSPSLLLSPHPSCSLPIPPALSPSLLLSPHPSCSLPIPPALSPSLLLSPHPSCSLPIPPALSPSLLLSPHPSCSLPIPPALSPSLLLSPHPSCSLPIPPALSPSLLLSPHPSCSLPIPPALSPSLLLSPHPSCSLPTHPCIPLLSPFLPCAVQSYWLEPHTDVSLSLHHSGFSAAPPTCSSTADSAAARSRGAGGFGDTRVEAGEVDLGEVDLGEVDLGEVWDQQVQEEQEENLKAGTLSMGLKEQPSPDGTFPFPPTPRLLFYPPAIPVRVDPFRCPPPIPPVHARPGIFLTARITPALPGVNVSVVADSASDAGGWQLGEVVGWRLTEGWRRGGEERREEEEVKREREEQRREMGENDVEEMKENTEEVTLGPLYDDASYHVELNKEGYIFSSTGDNSYTAERAEATQQMCNPGSKSGGEQQECKWQS